MTREQEIAWFAGLIEGEGCVSVTYGHHGRPRVQLALSMTDRDVLEHALQVFPSSGKIHQNVRRDKPHWKPCFRVRWGSSAAESILLAILPFMGERRAAKIRETLALELSHHPRKAAV